MEDMIGIIVGLGTFAFLILLGLIVGKSIERKHFASLADREARFRMASVTQSKVFFLPNKTTAIARTKPPTMLTSEVTLASDYLKTFLAGLRKLIGGEVIGFGKLMERARREAIQRLVEQAQARGYNALCNVRLDAVDIGGALSKNGAKMVSIVATATAYVSETAGQADAAIPVAERIA